MSINLGLKMIRGYNPALTIIWNGEAKWADALYEDREGRKRFRVRMRDKKHLYPLVKDCQIPELEGRPPDDPLFYLGYK
jgi:hypothetical protein